MGSGCPPYYGDEVQFLKREIEKAQSVIKYKEAYITECKNKLEELKHDKC